MIGAIIEWFSPFQWNLVKGQHITKETITWALPLALLQHVFPFSGTIQRFDGELS